jgi:glutaredoxin
MFSTQWCGHCRNARAYFAAKGIAFNEIDVEASPAGYKEYKQLGGKGVPLILVGKKVMRGFSAERFEAMRR